MELEDWFSRIDRVTVKRFDPSTYEKLFNLTSYYLKALGMGVYLKPYESLNSGVVRISKADRSEKTFGIMLNLLKNFRKGCPGDQEIILLWMKKFNKKISLDFRMNFQARFFNALESNDKSMLHHDLIRKAAEDIHIIHFNGPKPDSAEFLYHPWTLGRNELVEMYQSYL
ncbi:MAG TPA: hypothetical protein VF623_07615 [Segetibacter sp.]